MAPVPLEGHQTPVPTNLPQEGNRGGSISLGMLIDFIIQRTYHELTVLAELLPRKTDMERKLEIWNFSARTRQLFVRLLALVKWANSASKVDKSAHIMNFLDKQSLLFVDTADMLARMARETLVHARLPNFHIPAAVEVLTTGTYGRLPACIRERIVPPDPITPVEKRTTLHRLNQVIQHRLVTGNLLPQMRNLKIEAGRVTFLVEQEFSVSLTVMGDGPNVPWRLLDLEILVSDRETGDGKALVHPLQTRYVHQVVQARLAESSNSLSEVYYILHYFCQSLQLEVLYSQTLRLIRDRLDDHIHVDEYVPGKGLTISYWRELTTKDPRSELGYKLSVQVDQSDPARPLAVVHVPSLGSKEEEIADRAIRSEQLSMECLLVHTIYIRTRNRLNELKQEIQGMVKDVECTLNGSPAILAVPILQPCLRAELLLVTVDTHTGMLQCHVPQYEAPLVPELTSALNNDHSKLNGLISELRFWITQRRCEKTLQHLPATPHEKLPILHNPEFSMANISKHRMFVRLHRHPTVILIVAFKEKESSPCEIECSFFMASVKPSSAENNQDENIESDIPKMYLRLQSLIEFDTFVITHGPFTSVDSGINEQDGGCITDVTDKGNKRRSTGPNGRQDASGAPQNRRPKHPAYFIPELAHVVALCDERIPFITLALELTKRDIAHQGLQVEANATALVLKPVLLPAPSPSLASSPGWQALLKRLLSVSIRVQGKGMAKTWMAEFVFYSSPLTSSHPKEQGLRRPVYFQYEMGTSETVSRTVDSLLNNWAQIVHLYTLVQDLSEYFKMEKHNLRNMVSIKSYNYSKLILAYGPNRGAIVTVHWSTNEKAFKLVFGKSPTNTTINAHSLMKEQLEAHLNRHRNLAQIIFYLNETLQPLISISKLPIIPQLGVLNPRPQVPVQTFTVMPQYVTSVRLAYQGMYCLELRVRGGGLVSLRDGAYSRFDRSNVVDEFTPTQGLKTFLSKYVDESAVFRRRSQSEDDNPPSPVTMDSEAPVGFMTHHRGGPQSPAQQRDGLRFHPPLTPPSGSNPHTPASPHTANISQASQHQSFGSSPATSFNLASPPSLPPNTPNMLPHPSPGGLVANSPLNQMHVPSPAGLMPTSSPGPCSNVQVGHSPASSFMQGHMDGSPFPSSQSMASPAASNWPGSPSVPRPSPARPGNPGHAMHSPQPSDHKIGSHISRVLPQRSWAGAVPTLLTYEALDILCSPSPHPSGLPGPDLSPLERFLGCVYMRRQLQRFIQTDDCLTSINSTEPGVVHFKVETLQCRVGLNPQHLQSLHIKVQPLPEHQDKWTLEELQIIEKFFDTRAAAPPYKPNTLCGFGRMLNVPFNVLKDFIQIMKLELVPGLVQQQQLKWSIQWCLKVPPSATAIVPTGMAGVLVCKNKILFFIQLTRVGVPYQGEPLSLALPLVYDVQTNLTQLAERRDSAPSPSTAAASMQLKRFVEYPGVNYPECSLFPAVRDLLANLTLPSEPPVMPQVVASPAAGQVTPTQQIQSPAMQMHSPMAGGQGPPQGPYGMQGMPSMGMMGGPPQ